MIHVCFGLHDRTGRYSKFTGTTILSLFENTYSDVTIHILHDDTLTADNREKFIYLAGRYGQAVKFYNVEKLCFDKLTEMINLVPDVIASRVSVGAFYRLLTPIIFPPDIEKIIYLDSDLIVNLDIKELWQVELGGKIFAAVPEIFNGVDIQRAVPLCREGYVKGEHYFNSGILLMNLKVLRGEEATLKRGIEFRGKRGYGCFDQDILNYLFSEDYLKLPVKFNYFVKSHRSPKEVITNGKIYHYTASQDGVGLSLELSDSFNRLWMDYFIKSPWFDSATIGRLYDNFWRRHVELKESMMNLSTAMSGRTRAFILFESNLNLLLENFSVRNDEEVFLIEHNTPLQKLVDTINASRAEKIFFILIPKFPFDALKEAGLVYGKDFINGYDFLLTAQDQPPLSYSFLAEM